MSSSGVASGEEPSEVSATDPAETRDALSASPRNDGVAEAVGPLGFDEVSLLRVCGGAAEEKVAATALSPLPQELSVDSATGVSAGLPDSQTRSPSSSHDQWDAQSPGVESGGAMKQEADSFASEDKLESAKREQVGSSVASPLSAALLSPSLSTVQISPSTRLASSPDQAPLLQSSAGAVVAGTRRRTRTASPRRCLIWQAMAKKVERIKGVCYSSTRHEWIAVGPVQLGSGRKKNIYFSVAKFGFVDARQLAIECRRRQERVVELGEGAPDATAIAAELTAEFQARRQKSEGDKNPAFEQDSELLQSLASAELAASGSFADSSEEAALGFASSSADAVLPRRSSVSRKASTGVEGECTIEGARRASCVSLAEEASSPVNEEDQNAKGGGPSGPEASLQHRPYALRRKRRYAGFFQERDDADLPPSTPKRNYQQGRRPRQLHQTNSSLQHHRLLPTQSDQSSDPTNDTNEGNALSLVQPDQQQQQQLQQQQQQDQQGSPSAGVGVLVKKRGRPRQRLSAEAQQGVSVLGSLESQETKREKAGSIFKKSGMLTTQSAEWSEREERFEREKQQALQQRANLALIVKAVAVFLEDLTELCSDAGRLFAAGLPSEAVRICLASSTFIAASTRRVAAATASSQLEDYVRLFRECIVAHTLPSETGPEQILRLIEGLARIEEACSTATALQQGSAATGSSLSQTQQSLLHSHFHQSQTNQQQLPHLQSNNNNNFNNNNPTYQRSPITTLLHAQQQQHQQQQQQLQHRQQQQHQRLMEQHLRAGAGGGGGGRGLKTDTAGCKAQFSHPTHPRFSSPFDDSRASQSSQLATATAAFSAAPCARWRFPPRDSVLRKYASFDRWRDECVAALQRAEAFRDLSAVGPLREAIGFVLEAE